VTNADLVVDVGVRNRQVGHHEIRDGEPFQHLLDDQAVHILVGADRIETQNPESRNVGFFPEVVEVDRFRGFVFRGSRGLPGAERHHHETDGANLRAHRAFF
jgi:hypothetical protein